MFSPSGRRRSSGRPFTVPHNARNVSARGTTTRNSALGTASGSRVGAGNRPHADIVPRNLDLSTHEYNADSLDDTRIPYRFITGSDGYASMLEGFQRFARNNPDFSIESIIPSTLMDRVHITDDDVALEQETLTLVYNRFNDETNTLLEAEKGATSCEKEVNVKIKKLKEECLDIIDQCKKDFQKKDTEIGDETHIADNIEMKKKALNDYKVDFGQVRSVLDIMKTSLDRIENEVLRDANTDTNEAHTIIMDEFKYKEIEGPASFRDMSFQTKSEDIIRLRNMGLHQNSLFVDHGKGARAVGLGNGSNGIEYHSCRAALIWQFPLKAIAEEYPDVFRKVWNDVFDKPIPHHIAPFLGGEESSATRDAVNTGRSGDIAAEDEDQETFHSDPSLVNVDESSKEFQLALKLTQKGVRNKEAIVEFIRVAGLNVSVVDDSFVALLLQVSGRDD